MVVDKISKIRYTLDIHDVIKEYIVTATISNWGNSQGIRLPKDIIKSMSLVIGDKVNVLVENHKIIIEPVQQKKVFDINELVSKMPQNYKIKEEITGIVGKEVW